MEAVEMSAAPEPVAESRTLRVPLLLELAAAAALVGLSVAVLTTWPSRLVKLEAANISVAKDDLVKVMSPVDTIRVTRDVMSGKIRLGKFTLTDHGDLAAVVAVHIGGVEAHVFVLPGQTKSVTVPLPASGATEMSLLTSAAGLTATFTDGSRPLEEIDRGFGVSVRAFR